jgi:hypothetical protein
MKRKAKRWTLSDSDTASVLGLSRRANKLEDKGSPELHAVRGKIRAALASGSQGIPYLSQAERFLEVASRQQHGVDPEAALEGVALAAEALAALVLDLRAAS